MMDGHQFGFDALLRDAHEDNAARMFERETAHLPGTWAKAVAFHRQQIVDHHAAMLANGFDAAIAIRREAHLLARKLNGGNPGILASDEAPGWKRDAHSAASNGEVPEWGQRGSFEINADGMIARVEMGGMFSIGATAMPYLGFSVRAADTHKPFLSSTGYRSFLGASVPPERGMAPEGFVRFVIEHHVQNDLRGKLVRIDP